MWQKVTNTVVYYGTVLIATVKSSMKQAPIEAFDAHSREPLLKGKAFSTVDLLVPTSSDQLLWIFETIISFDKTSYLYQEFNRTDLSP
jgi:hypothetical protein